MTKQFEKTYGQYKVRGDYEVDDDGAINIVFCECLGPCPKRIRSKLEKDLWIEENLKDEVFPRELYHKTREWEEEKHGVKLRSIEFSL